jgi:glycosyltransferase involved in cell wall biosynthesis
VVLPSTCSETFGRVLIEAMACGTPVIGSRVGGVPEVLTGEFAEWLVAPGDERDLAGALERVQVRRAADPDIGRRCRVHIAEHFPVDRTIDALERVLLDTAREWTRGVRRFAAPALS